MSDQFAPRRHHSSDPPDAVSGAGAQAPGKKAPTDRLPARSTGVPIVDDGTACDRGEGGEQCFLEKDQRNLLLTVISERAGIVGANARDALQDSRIDELTEKPEGWNALAEFMFYSATGPIIGMVASRIVNEAVKENVKAVMINVSRAQRKVLMGAANAPAPGKASKVRFLELCRDAIGPWQMALFEDAPRDLTDEGIIALKDSLDPRTLTIDFFKGRIADMLTRFDKQQIDQIGVEAIYRHGVPMWRGHGANRRLILLEDHGLHNLTGSSGPKPRDLIHKLGRDKKPIVIDKDLEPMALAFYFERTGQQPIELDIEAGLQAGGELASGILDDLLSLGGAK